MRRKTKTRARSLSLLVITVVILGGIWAADQLTRAGLGPAWIAALWAESDVDRARIGLLAGHSGNDSGAVCPDGLTEAEVNARVAALTAEKLRARGFHVDILDEYDSALAGYKAAVFVSIHSDSCEVPFSGFKVARHEWGSAASEDLVQCLWDRYGTETGLLPHTDTITFDMTRYHAFREIAASTPAAIIELGFLNADRDLLVEQPERAAAGIVSGILCFLEPAR